MTWPFDWVATFIVVGLLLYGSALAVTDKQKAGYIVTAYLIIGITAAVLLTLL